MPGMPGGPIAELVANRFEIEAHIGAGGMGDVFRARDRLLGEVVALKRLKAEAGLETGPGHDAIERFRQEVRLARRVTHRNVARVYDLVEADGAVFLTMELVDGASLRRVLKDRGPLMLREAARIGVDVCAALSAMHRVGIVHRDLKPENILLDGAGRVVVTDFGIARPWHDPGTGSISGTPHYMAPEQAVGRPVGPQADIYALGIVVAEMVIGGAVFGDQRTAAARGRGSSVGAVADVVRRCMELDPAARPASAYDVERALVAVVVGGGGHVESPPPPQPAPPPVPARRDDVATVPASRAAAVARALPVMPALAVAVTAMRVVGDRDELAAVVAGQIADTSCRGRASCECSRASTRSSRATSARAPATSCRRSARRRPRQQRRDHRRRTS